MLRRKAGSPGLQAEGEEEDNLPSTSSTRQDIPGGSLLERHRKAKAKAEKAERRRRDRLDFDFPSETARKEKRRAEKAGLGDETIVDVAEPGGASLWETGGHLNLFADLERVCMD